MDDTKFDEFKREFKTMLDAQTITNEALERARNDREVIRNRMSDEFQGEMRGAMKTLQGKIADHDKRFETQEAETDAKIASAIASVGNVEDKVDGVVKLLEGQNKASEAAAKAAKEEKEEARKNESIQVRHKNDSIRAKTPALLAMISFLGLLVTDISSCLNNRASNQLTATRMTELAQKVETVNNLTAQIASTAVPAASASPSSSPTSPTIVLPQTEIAASVPKTATPSHHAAENPTTHMARQTDTPASPAAAPAAAGPVNANTK